MSRDGLDPSASATLPSTGGAGWDKVPNSSFEALTYTLVLHPLAAGLGLVAGAVELLMSPSCERPRCLIAPCLSTILTSLASLAATAAFAVDLATFLIFKSRLKDANAQCQATLGNALWITVAAWFAILLGSCGLETGLCRARRNVKGEDLEHDRDPTPYGQAVPLGRVSSSRTRPTGLWAQDDNISDK